MRSAIWRYCSIQGCLPGLHEVEVLCLPIVEVAARSTAVAVDRKLIASSGCSMSRAAEEVWCTLPFCNMNSTLSTHDKIEECFVECANLTQQLPCCPPVQMLVQSTSRMTHLGSSFGVQSASDKDCEISDPPQPRISVKAGILTLCRSPEQTVSSFAKMVPTSMNIAWF